MKKIILIMLAVLLMGLLFAGCGGEEETPEVYGPPMPAISTPEVDPVTEPEQEEKEVVYEGTVANTTNGVNIRSEPSTESEIITAVETGEKFIVLETGEWCKVELQGGYGYIHSDYLELEEIEAE